MQNCAQLFTIFCATFSTNFAQLLDFLSATFWGDCLEYEDHVSLIIKIKDNKILTVTEDKKV